MAHYQRPLSLSLSLLLALMALWSCAAARPEGASITLTDKDQGRTVQVRLGGTLTIKLAAQLGTGFSWRVVKNEARLLAPVGEPGLERQGEGRPGAPELQVFRFRAAASGTSVLELAYSRPWEKTTPPAKVFRITVEVR